VLMTILWPVPLIHYYLFFCLQVYFWNSVVCIVLFFLVMHWSSQWCSAGL
jgi:hypothetical protein